MKQITRFARFQLRDGEEKNLRVIEIPKCQALSAFQSKFEVKINLIIQWSLVFAWAKRNLQKLVIYPSWFANSTNLEERGSIERHDICIKHCIQVFCYIESIAHVFRMSVFFVIYIQDVSFSSCKHWHFDAKDKTLSS